MLQEMAHQGAVFDKLGCSTMNRIVKAMMVGARLLVRSAAAATRGEVSSLAGYYYCVWWPWWCWRRRRRAAAAGDGGAARRGGGAEPELLRQDVPQRGGAGPRRRDPEAPGDLQRRARHPPPLLPRLLRQGM